MSAPANPPMHRPAPDPRRVLAKLCSRLDRRAAGALLTVLEIMADLDGPRAARLIEAVSLLVMFAPRRTRRTGGEL